MWSSISSATLESPAGTLSRSYEGSPSDRRFLRSLYIDLTGRSPLPPEVKAAQGRSRAELSGSLAGGGAFYDGFYEEELFYFLLIDNFRPSTDLFEELPQLLAKRKTSVRDALRHIVSSQFFNARNPGNDTFVTVVLEQLLGTTVQKNVRTLEAGKKMYDGVATKFLGEKGSSQADLVRIAVEHEDFEPFLLGRQFQAIFREPMPRKALQADARKLRDNPLAYPEILNRWIDSEAYESRLQIPRTKTDRGFIRCLFVDVLGRKPTYQEFRRSRNALLALSDSGPLRSVLIKLILDSDLVQLPSEDQLQTSLTDLFLQYLCRQPTPQEEAAFRAELAAGSSTRTLVRALLAHWEYQHY